jgi:N-acetylglutamate synthase-like GNAT family acetyltransferase
MSKFIVQTFTPEYEKEVIHTWKEGVRSSNSRLGISLILKKTFYVPLFSFIFIFTKNLLFFLLLNTLYFVYICFQFEKMKAFFSNYVNTQLDMKSSSSIMEKYLKERNHFWVVVKKENKEFCGCIAVHQRENNTAEINRLSVDSKSRRKGLGVLLCLELEKFCREKQYREIYLETMSIQEEVVTFYKKLGYEEIGVYYTSDYIPISKMRKIL